MNKSINYKNAVEEIENIIAEMENQNVDIDELPEKVKRAMELIGYCKKKLYEIESESNKNFE